MAKKGKDSSSSGSILRKCWKSNSYWRESCHTPLPLPRILLNYRERGSMEEHTAQRLCFHVQERMALLCLLASNKLLKRVPGWFPELPCYSAGATNGFHKPHTLGQLQPWESKWVFCSFLSEGKALESKPPLLSKKLAPSLGNVGVETSNWGWIILAEAFAGVNPCYDWDVWSPARGKEEWCSRG